MTPLVTRLRTFLDHKGIGVIAFAQALGYKSPQKIYRLFNTEGASPSVQIVEDIKRAFPELNMNWLFGGDEYMIERIDVLLSDLRTLTRNSLFIEYYTHEDCECYKIINEYTPYAECKVVVGRVDKGYIPALKDAIKYIKKARSKFFQNDQPCSHSIQK